MNKTHTMHGSCIKLESVDFIYPYNLDDCIIGFIHSTGQFIKQYFGQLTSAEVAAIHREFMDAWRSYTEGVEL